MNRLNTSGQAAVAVLVLLLVIGSACFASSYVTITPLQGYFNGGNVYYLLTDVSDSALATTLHANYTPLLANAIANGYLNYAYYVTNNPQGLVFSTQWPAAYSPGSYMPIWVLQNVTWTSGSPVTLKSVADITAHAGNLMVRRTTIIIGASILINSLGASIPQGHVSLTPTVTIALPVAGVYVNNVAYRMLRLEFSDASEARVYGGIWSPNLAKFDYLRARSLPAAWQDVFTIWSIPPLGQLPVARQAPPNALYSPLMDEWAVFTTSSRAAPYTSYAAVVASLLRTSQTNYWDYQPIIGP